jgi:hypothetical protein
VPDSSIGAGLLPAPEVEIHDAVVPARGAGECAARVNVRV